MRLEEGRFQGEEDETDEMTHRLYIGDPGKFVATCLACMGGLGIHGRAAQYAARWASDVEICAIDQTRRTGGPYFAVPAGRSCRV